MALGNTETFIGFVPFLIQETMRLDNADSFV